MVSRKRIDQWSFWYWLLKNFLVKPAYYFYYKKIQIVNEKNLSDNAAVIIAPNHQNALMDAMVFVTGTRFQTVFLARADVFKSPFLIKVLTFIKILPIYRIRDGRESLQKNDEIFDYTVNILRNRKNPLLLFPEGNHGDKRRLRPLVKGIFRIAFQGQEHYGSKPGVKIIPTGIDYHHYQKFNQTQLVVFGEPIEVVDYWKEYNENPALAMNSLRERLSAEMKKLMINIETEQYYELYMGLRGVCNESFCKKMGYSNPDLYDKFQADKKMIDLLDECLISHPDKIEYLNNLYTEYAQLKKELKLRDWVGRKRKYSILLNLLILPLSVLVWPMVLLGLINNWPHFLIPPRFIKNIKDQQFHSTVKWGIGFVFLLVYYLTLIVLALFYIPQLWLKLAYIISLGISGTYVLEYRSFFIKTIARLRYSFKVMMKNSQALRFYELRKQIVKITTDLLA